MSARDIVMIGAGVNGLVTATLLAKAGRKPLVLEGAEHVGGCAITSEIVPGFRCPTLSHWAAIDAALVRELGLERHGLQIAAGEALGCVPSIDGRALTIWRDQARARQDLAAVSAPDADRYPKFVASVERGERGRAKADRRTCAVDRRARRRGSHRPLENRPQLSSARPEGCVQPPALAADARLGFCGRVVRTRRDACRRRRGGRLRIAPRPAIGRQHGDLPADVGAPPRTARLRVDGTWRHRRGRRRASPPRLDRPARRFGRAHASAR